MALSGSQITREAAGGWGERKAGSFAGKTSTVAGGGKLRRTVAGRLGRTVPIMIALAVLGGFV